MIYILETEIDSKKSLMFALNKVLGLGSSKTNLICKKLGVSGNFKTSELSSEKLFKLIKVVEKLNTKITNSLKKEVSINIKTLIEIKSYRGLRRVRRLPVRGQRTRTNKKTAYRELKRLF